jgi:hypothetical protein
MFPNFIHARARLAVRLRTVRARVFRRQTAVTSLIVVEALLTAVPFLLSWWLCALYRCVIAGWMVSGVESNVKRAMLARMMGDNTADPALFDRLQALGSNSADAG